MDTDDISIEPGHIKTEVEKNSDTCVCPQCGYETKKRMGVPCRSMKCPVCEKSLIGK